MKKVLRKNINAKALFISDDKSIESEFQNEFKELIVLNNKLFSSLNDIENSDIIILDFDLKKDFINEIMELIAKKLAFVPIIAIGSKQSEEVLERAINLKAYTFLAKPYTKSQLGLSILMCLNQTQRSDKFKLSEGIYYDKYKDQFFDKSNTMIEFTRLEKGFLKLLIDRLDEMTDYDMIQEEVWKGKKMSIFTMRNIVNKIRIKTYYDIIRNHSGRGYTIDLSNYSK
ncbi:response regulator transcription factor [Arcobacter porcinus]|uniref:response regulator transcription factor n=1 Tax=Arcobacter porcinus TaxID=1935204 RepID=UPI00081E7570|nr:response regulator transcription factor [Arcobacter porcinus]OCL82759.1 Response regulator receiver domain protein [Arcobacter porcinus]